MWRKYRYTWALLVSIVFAVFLFFSGYLHAITHVIGGYGYVTALLAGMMFSISVTAPTASLIFFELGDVSSPLLYAVIGGIGAMCSDLILYRFFKTSLLEE